MVVPCIAFSMPSARIMVIPLLGSWLLMQLELLRGDDSLADEVREAHLAGLEART